MSNLFFGKLRGISNVRRLAIVLVVLCFVVLSYRPGSNVVQGYTGRIKEKTSQLDSSRIATAVDPPQHQSANSLDETEFERLALNESRFEVSFDEELLEDSPSREDIPTTTTSSDSTASPTPELPDPVPTRSAVHQRYLTIATMLRNKRPYLREWIEFNFLIGVEHIIIYDNNSTDLPLEILQYYIDQGTITYVLWPPPAVPKFPAPKTKLEEWQYAWMHDALETCLDDSFTIHKQGPCQMAAFLDAIWRTDKGVSRWLGVWDVDEFIFPREHSGFKTLSSLLRAHFSDFTHLEFQGNVFGTSGHALAPQRKPGSALPALITEEYTYRAELDHHGEDPFRSVGADGWEVHGKGLLKSFRFAGGDDYARKSMADPEMVSHCWVHFFLPVGNVDVWKDTWLTVESDLLKFNHYAFLSRDEAKKKSETNRNPFMAFRPEIDEFFSRERDTEVHYLLPALKQRMLHTIQDHPPLHPDDWRG